MPQCKNVCKTLYGGTYYQRVKRGNMVIKLYKKMVLVLAVCAAAALAGVGYYGAVLPDQYIFEEGAPYTLQGDNCFSFRVSPQNIPAKIIPF